MCLSLNNMCTFYSRTKKKPFHLFHQSHLFVSQLFTSDTVLYNLICFQGKQDEYFFLRCWHLIFALLFCNSITSSVGLWHLTFTSFSGLIVRVLSYRIRRSVVQIQEGHVDAKSLQLPCYNFICVIVSQDYLQVSQFRQFRILEQVS